MGVFSFVVLLFLFLLAGQEKTPRGRLREEAAEMVKRGGGVRWLRRDCGGAFGRVCGPRWWQMHPGASGGEGVEGRRALARGPQANMMNEETSG